MTRLPLIVLAAILCAAAWLRLQGLERGTFGHIESYTPGIVYPPSVSDPPTRIDQWRNFVWAINDVHGPFWYFWMLPYTKAFGTSLTALRLPSALLGMAAVLLTYLVALRAGGRWTAPLAAALLAFSGHHVFWSRQARFYSSVCFLSVLSTWLLLRAVEGKSRWNLAAYLAASLAGLATIYYYWPVTLVQLLWVVAIEARRPSILAGWQLWLFTLATPLLTLAIYQARPGPYLAREDWRFLGGYFTFGFQLTPTIDSGSDLRWETVFVWILPPLAAVCLGFGLWALRRSAPAAETGRIGRHPELPQACACGSDKSPPVWLMFVTACGASAAIWYAGSLGGVPFPHKIPLLRISAAFPFAGFAGYLFLRRFSKALPVLPALRSPLGLVAMIAILPAFMIAGIAQAVPFYAPRGMLCFSALLLILLARGVVSMGRAGLVVAAVLLIASMGSVRTAIDDPGAVDYAGVARQWVPQIQPGDRIFVAKHWSTTPELYYLREHYEQIVGERWLDTAAPRVWAILIPGAPRPAEFVEALERRRRIATFRSARIEVALFERQR